MHKTLLTISLFLILFTLGCNGENKKPIITQDFNVKKDIKESSKRLKDSTKKIEDEAAIISDKTVEIKTKSKEGMLADPNKVPINLFSDINKSSNSILEHTDLIRTEVGFLSNIYSEYLMIGNKVGEISDNSKILIKERNTAVEENVKLKQELKSHLTKLIRLIIGGCIVGIGIFGALAVFGNPKGGVFGALSCGITLVLAIAVGQNLAIIAWAGTGILIFGILLVIFSVYSKRKALTEIILTTEEIKKDMDETTKEKIFGKNEKVGLASKIQSKLTQTLVNKERKKIKPKE
jgi:hypothetical protein